MNSTDPGGQDWSVVWLELRTMWAWSYPGQWTSLAICYCLNWFSLLWDIRFWFCHSPWEWEYCFPVTCSFPSEYHVIEFTRFDVQVEERVGLVAIETSRKKKKNKWEKSVTLTDVHKSVCICVCVWWRGGNTDSGEPDRILARREYSL